MLPSDDDHSGSIGRLTPTRAPGETGNSDIDICNPDRAGRDWSKC